MKQQTIWKKFIDLKIREKLLISNVGIILLMAFFLGCTGYVVSKNLLVSGSVKNSEELAEQLSFNFNYAVKALEDQILMQTYKEEFSQIIRGDALAETDRSSYYREKEIQTYSYNLINFNNFIKTVIIQDEFDNIYHTSEDDREMTPEEMKQCLAYDETFDMWGTTYWKNFDDRQVFASRLVFDYRTMKPLAVVAVGVDKEYFTSLYKNIIEDGSSGIVVLNQKREILMESSSESREIAESIIAGHDFEKEKSKEIVHKGRKYIYTIWQTEGERIQVMNLLSESSILRIIYQLLKSLLISALIGILLSAVLAIVISGGISANIRYLLNNIRKISQGDFSQKIEPQSKDEVGMLASEFNEMSEKIQELLVTVTNEKILKKNSQLKALQYEYDSLQAKINPHFLYNTLESINSLAKIRKEQKIADSIYLLGNYLREAISSKKKFVTLEQEIENIRNYVQIQQISYGDKVQFHLQTEEALQEVMVPKMILQPLVENAIVHGIEPKMSTGSIRIFMCSDKGDMYISVWDDGVGIFPEQIENLLNGNEEEDGRHTRVGLMAVHKRIQILYGSEYGLSIKSEKGYGTEITVKLPIKFEDEVDLNEI